MEEEQGNRRGGTSKSKNTKDIKYFKYVCVSKNLFAMLKIFQLKELQAKRKEVRAQQEKELAEQKREEEERVRREEAEKKAKEADEKRRRLEEAEKKRQTMVQSQRERMDGSGSYDKGKMLGEVTDSLMINL